MRAPLAALVSLALVRVVAAGGMPDLVLDVDRLAAEKRFDIAVFADDACELQPADRCVGGPGARKLLRFSVLAINEGTADLVLGAPPNIAPPNRGSFVYSACHAHFHFDSFARYELRARRTGAGVAPGAKRSFCISDTVPPGPGTGRRYCCTDECHDVQGLQIGWGDLYASDLPCQWIDVTDVPPGDYDLCVRINSEGLIAESPAGDAGCVAVSLTASAGRPPRVKIRAPRAHARLHVGRRLRVVWRKRVRGRLLFQTVLLSRDGGVTYTTLGRTMGARGRLAVPIVPTMATDQGRVRVYACARNPKDDSSAGAFLCGDAESGPFRILP